MKVGHFVQPHIADAKSEEEERRGEALGLHVY
jgi:hypothetical protein